MQLKSSPFIYGQTVSKQTFTNRESELEKLTGNMLRGIHTIIMSPRRWGKSSLVEKAVNSVTRKNKNCRAVIIDLFSVGSEKEFMELFAREVIKAASNKWEERLQYAKEVFRQLIPKITMGTDPFSEFSVSFDLKDLQKHGDEILNLPEVLAKKKEIRMVICLDEFQNLSTFHGYEMLEKKMRAVWQRHKQVSYCLFGSRRNMLTTIFNDPAKPFYRFGDVMLLKKIDHSKWVKFISDRFSGTGKKITPEAAALIPSLMKNHSWYVQQLSHYTWNLTRNTATAAEVQAAFSEVVGANTPFFQREVEGLSATQVNLLKAIASGASQLTGVETMNSFNLGTPNNVAKNRKKIVDADIVDESGDALEFADPVFEFWFRKSFLIPTRSND